MTRPRKALISLADTPYYHITSRCVRRAFLCGVDHYSGKNYEHRRQWVVDRIRLLVFALCHRRLRLCGDEQSLPPGVQDLPGTDSMEL